MIPDLLRRRPDFRRVWLSGLVSMIGDWVTFTGLPLVVYDLTGSTLATGAMFLAGIVPRVAFGSLAGVFVDRWDRRRIMIVANLAHAVFLLPLLAVDSEAQLWIVYVVAVVQATLASSSSQRKVRSSRASSSRKSWSLRMRSTASTTTSRGWSGR